MLKIFGRKDSINVMKVLWLCEELALRFERIDVGGRFAFSNAPDYGRMNPNRRVPTIDDGGFLLWESNVIVRYLASTYGGGELLPAGRPRWIVQQWMDWQQTTLHPPMRTHPNARARVAAPARRAFSISPAAAASVCPERA